MAASDQTVRDAVDVILRHVNGDTARKIVNDLRRVSGNTSFRETIARIDIELADREHNGRR